MLGGFPLIRIVMLDEMVTTNPTINHRPSQKTLFRSQPKIDVRDDENWFANVFVTGPGWQMAQKFVENILREITIC